MKIGDIEDTLSDNIRNCEWIDYFWHKIKINVLAIVEVLILIEKN